MEPRAKQTYRGDIFLTLSAKGGDGKLDPFVVGDTIEKAIGYKAKAEINTDGSYLIRVQSEEIANKLTKLKKLNDDTKIKIEKHKWLNKSKCVIKHDSIKEITDETLMKRLKPQGVTGVRSIKTNKSIKILEINRSAPPEYITLGLIQVQTQKYYPMPRVCHRCKEIGHITEKCLEKTRCGSCSEVGEHGDNCTKPPWCTNCKGNHPPTSKRCPLYTQEKEIIRIQIDHNLAPSAARRSFRSMAGKHYLPLPISSNRKTPNEDEPNGTTTMVNQNDPMEGSSMKTSSLQDEVILIPISSKNKRKQPTETKGTATGVPKPKTKKTDTPKAVKKTTNRRSLPVTKKEQTEVINIVKMLEAELKRKEELDEE